VRFKSLGQNRQAIRYGVIFNKLNDALPPFQEDVAVRLKHGPASVVDRVGTIVDCEKTLPGGLRCRE